MNAAILTNEFPPEIYGGAGIHVKFLTQELAKLCHVEARCFGSQDVDEDNIRALGFSRKLALNPEDDRFQKIFKPLDINIRAGFCSARSSSRRIRWNRTARGKRNSSAMAAMP